MPRKNKKYLLNRRHSSNDDEPQILQTQKRNSFPSCENGQRLRRSITVPEGDERLGLLRLESAPENLTRSSPALLNTANPAPPRPPEPNRPEKINSQDVEEVGPPPPLPPRRPKPRSNTLRGNFNRQGSTRIRASFLPVSRQNSSPSPSESFVNVIRNVDGLGLMSVIDYGASRQNENSDPFTMAWRPNLNSQTFQPFSEHEDPPPSYEEAMKAKEKEQSEARREESGDQ